MQHFLTKLFGGLMKAWSWILLIIAAISIKFVSTQPLWVEEKYSTGLYPLISEVQRSVFGWIPFSIGDLFYAFLVLIIIFKTVQLIKYIYRKKINRQYLLNGLKQVLFFFLFVYVFFYGLWGLNYNRKGISYQLNLEVRKYTVQEIDTITNLLQRQLNFYADTISLMQRDSFNKKKTLFEKATEAYLYANNSYPFLSYEPQSIKPSLFSYLGNYFGFQGYYNPFSGEGQVNTRIPRFLEPFVSAHEVAHQLGYAKENEANFVAFIACKSYPNNTYRYSMYFDMYLYAITELDKRDSVLARSYNEKLHPQAKKDIDEYRKFLMKYRNQVEPIISWIYDGYLQANDQPEGKKTYNMVVALLIAYYKKFGAEAV
ncbi:MAG TPA: DUF3810 domain-containing protein [Chitinophagaceae bacterium]|nr:DUF3810 domain-containing protein [Chitinophagaceae bacterium]